MIFVKDVFKRIILLIILISLLISFLSIPQSYAKIELESDEFYYTGVTEGEYVVKPSFFGWLLDFIGQIADYLIGIMTMMFRMVFVGWTALFEKLLTGVMEATVGVGLDQGYDSSVNGNMENAESLKSDSNHTNWSDPTNNLTVQAIVFNKVPAFNINFFEDDRDFLYGVTGTGNTLYCMGKNCRENGYPKRCADCCKPENYKEGDELAKCTCGCGPGNREVKSIPCANCRRYVNNVNSLNKKMNNLNDENRPPILLIRDAIAAWYYVLRLLSIAAMLVALIAIGIKMALSTIASDKAVYKRMLVDWVAGMIIVFGIHYVMLFIVYMNNMLVDTIETASNKIHTIEMKQISDPLQGQVEDDVIKKTNQDLELNIYEMIRTRAYDPKLTVGLSGMIMYMTLVYFAIRYSIVYFKRYFSVAILTLLGPPLGVAYALQRTLTGKSTSLRLWFTEYLTNVIIQSVHALIYGIFIASALVLSMESISGMIIALILMNFALKADKLFRRIFKFGNGGGIADEMAEAGSAEKMRNMVNAGVGFAMAAKPAANMLRNSAYGKAVTGTLRAATGTVGLAAIKTTSHIGKGISNISQSSKDKKFEKNVNEYMQNHADELPQQNPGESDEDYQVRRREEAAKLYSEEDLSPKKLSKNDFNLRTTMKPEEVLSIGEPALKADMIEKTKRFQELSKSKNDPKYQALYTIAKAQMEDSRANYALYKSINPGTGKKLMGNIHEVSSDESFGGIFKKSFASYERNGEYRLGTKLSEDASISTALFAGMLGLSKEEVKEIKEDIINPTKATINADFQMLAGLATVVAHPKLGMVLIGNGARKRSQNMKPKKGYKPYKGTYTFARYKDRSMLEVQKMATSGVRRIADNAVAETIAKRHPKLAERMHTEAMKTVHSYPMKNRQVSYDFDTNPAIRGKHDSTIGGRTTAGGFVTGAAASQTVIPFLEKHAIPGKELVGGAVTAGQSLALGVGGALAVRHYMATGPGLNAVELRRKANKRNEEAIQDKIHKACKKDEENNIVRQKAIARVSEKKVKEEYYRDFGVGNSDDSDGNDDGISDTVKTLKEDTESRYEEKLKKMKILLDSMGTETVKEEKKVEFSAKKLQVETKAGKPKEIKLSDKVIQQIDQELDKIVEKVAIDKNGDVTYEGDSKKIVEKLQDRLVAIGIVKRSETLKFKEQDIEKAIKRKRAFYEAKDEVLGEALVQTMDDQTKKKAVGGEGSKAKLSEVMKNLEDERAKLTSGTADDSSANMLKKVNQAMAEGDIYTSLNSGMKTPETSDRKIVEGAVDTKLARRRKKLNAVLSLTIDEAQSTEEAIQLIEDKLQANQEVTFTIGSGDRTVSDSIKVESMSTPDGKTKTKFKNQITLSNNDADEIVRQLLIRKEMELENSEALELLSEKKYSDDYKDATKAAKKARLDYMVNKREQLELEKRIDNRKDKREYNILNETDEDDLEKLKKIKELEEMKAKLEKINGEIKDKESKMKNALWDAEKAGPITNMNKLGEKIYK